MVCNTSKWYIFPKQWDRKGAGDMLYGEYRQTIDGKGRISIPAKMRDSLGEVFMIARGFKNNIYLYPMQEWHGFEDVIASKDLPVQMSLGLYFYSSAEEASLDAHGRVTIAQKFRDEIKFDKNIVIIGNRTHIELWREDEWDQYLASIDRDEIMRELMTMRR